MNPSDFSSAFKALTGHDPFPWQQRLFGVLRNGDLPPAVDIPTGLGKTAVMAIWLLARAAGAKLPARLVYVVDRRAVVDLATDFAVDCRQRLREEAALEPVRRGLGLADRELPISTLRGQHVDNREWLEDPAAPAVIVGTVDTIGSRLLFEGYGVSRGMRPYQAGLMGCDTLVMLDEAHLSGPFERLLRTIERETQAPSGNGAGAAVVAAGRLAGSLASARFPPRFRVLPLSATLGSAASPPFTLGEDDRKNETIKARLLAAKTLTVENCGSTPLEDVLARRAWDCATRMAEGAPPVRTLVYCNSRRKAESVAAHLRRRVQRARRRAAVILLVGGRRVHEREEAADDLRRHGVLAGGDVATGASVFVVATSAGEVGVDLDADHMVCDLVAWERMVLRLGRVNRRGSGAARVLVVDQGPPKKGSDADVARHRVARALLDALPAAGGGRQAGPAALESTAEAASRARTAAASMPAPLHPALTRPLVDAWAMTSLVDHSGRPEVAPWLHGWVERIPQTTVVWRSCLPVRVEEGSRSRTVPLEDTAIEAFFEVAPPHASERLETETSRVVDWLRKRARALTKSLQAPHDEGEPGAALEETGSGGPPPATDVELTARLERDAPLAFVLDSASRPTAARDGDSGCAISLREAASTLTVDAMERWLAGKLLVVDARTRGLRHGLLDAANEESVPTIEDNWGEAWALPGAAVRVRLLSDDERRPAATAPDEGQPADAWRELWVAPYRVSAADRTLTWLVVEKVGAAATAEDSRAMAPLQRLEEHQEAAAREAGRIADALGLVGEGRAMLVAAARHHDEGKRSKRWQRAFNAHNYKDGPYAKTPGPLQWRVLGGYRHELQSTLDAEATGLDGVDLSGARFELALHMIAAHHGRARPGIAVDGCDGLPPTAAAREAIAIALRFARLQRQWGPWGLAWWEALLRAADQRASRAFDEAARQARRATAAGAAD